jgi:hypothetical protein
VLPADELVELPTRDRGASGEPLADARAELLHLRSVDAAAHVANPPLAPRRARRQRERPVVARGDRVDRHAHERRLDDRAPLERARQRTALELRHPRPQPDVHRRRVLRLQAADSGDRLRDWGGRGLEQPLAREHRAVELARAEDALDHRDRRGAARSITSRASCRRRGG